jgi:hypothetical protein
MSTPMCITAGPVRVCGDVANGYVGLFLVLAGTAVVITGIAMLGSADYVGRIKN